MTCQPTIQVNLSLPVARDTKTHFKSYSLDAVHGFNLPMAFSTGHAFPDMTLVVKESKLRNIVNLYPRYRRLRLKIPMLFSYFRMVGNNVLVTIETLFHRRYPRKGGAIHIRVTKLTGYSLYSRMHLMAKRYRLFSTDTFFPEKVKKVKEEYH
jgi:hypothetical protein